MENTKLNYYDFSVINDNEKQRKFLYEHDGLYNIKNKYLVLNSHGVFYTIAVNLEEGETCPEFLSGRMPYPINTISKVPDLSNKDKIITPDRFLEKYFCDFHKCNECPMIRDFGVCRHKEIIKIRNAANEMSIVSINNNENYNCTENDGRE